MALDRLIALGPEKFQDIVSQLLQRVAARDIARIIQQDWALLQDIPESKLVLMLRRLYDAVRRGAFADVRRKVEQDCVLHIEELDHATVESLVELNESIKLQFAELRRVLEQQQGSMQPARHIASQVRAVRDLLHSSQAIKHELGLEKRQRSELVATLNGETDSQLFVAFAETADMFRKRGIHPPSLDEIELAESREPPKPLALDMLHPNNSIDSSVPGNRRGKK